MPDRDLATVTYLRLGPEDEGRVISADEFAEAEFAEPFTYERVQGRLCVMAPEGSGHVQASSPWRDRLVAYKLVHPEIVQDVVSNAWARIPGGTDRIGDIAVYLVGDEPTLPIPDRAPDLMFEIVSPSAQDRRRDYVEKRADYHRAGVREYVIVDRFRPLVTVLIYSPEGYAERVLTAADVYESPLLPGLAIRLAEVLGA